MSLLQRVVLTLGVFGLFLTVPSLVFAQSGYNTNGGEYAPAGNLPGDQVYPWLSLNASGGFLVWQDNVTDGDGYGISAVRLDSTFSPAFAPFRINQQGAYDQENSQVSMLPSGGAAFIWQSGPQSFQHIYARFLTPSNTFVGGDVLVSTATNYYQVNPALATLADGNLVAVWGSFGQDNADGLQGVYAQILSPTGQLLTTNEFLVNQFTPYNQRNPAIAAFPNGNFIVVWVSERERSAISVGAGGAVSGSYDSVDIYARLFNSNGVPVSDEFLVNTGTNYCADPAVATASDNSFEIVWGQKNTAIPNNGWDVFSRRFTSPTNASVVQGVNTQLYGDQYQPKISSLGTDYLVVWTSMGQDGSREGVYGQFLHGDGSQAGGEFRVNTTILNQQKFQAVASDGVGRFLVVWSSYIGGIDGMDLMAQRYATTQQPLSPPAPPFVSAIDSYTLSVTWPPLAGFSVGYWNLYADGSATPNQVSNLYWVNGNYNPGETHTFQLAYVLTNGVQSPFSTVASGKTWGADHNHDGLPDDWQTLYWGSNSASWPSPGHVLHVGGRSATVLQVFLWGANPLDSSTWLVQSMSQTSQGWFLNWNTQAGCVYQVLGSSDTVNWTNLGAPRFAAGTSDSLYLGLSTAGYYRIMRLVY